LFTKKALTIARAEKEGVSTTSELSEIVGQILYRIRDQASSSVKGRRIGWFILRMPSNGRVAKVTNTHPGKE
jgi:hypothetical protein